MKKSMKILLIVVGVIVVLVVITAAVFTSLSKKSEAAYELLLEAGAPEVDFKAVTDGVYKGSYKVFPVEVILDVTIAGGTVTDIQILKHVNGKGGPAEDITKDVLNAQSLRVDTVSGATFSSMVILKAIENALIKGELK